MTQDHRPPTDSQTSHVDEETVLLGQTEIDPEVCDVAAKAVRRRRLRWTGRRDLDFAPRDGASDSSDLTDPAT